MNRPGTVYQGFLPDGREVCVYPLLFGAGQITLGPADCPVGFDVIWEYEKWEEAVEAAEEWVGLSIDQHPYPEGYRRVILPGGAKHYAEEKT
jgi:hypothetical protein